MIFSNKLNCILYGQSIKKLSLKFSCDPVYFCVLKIFLKKFDFFLFFSLL
jgi:uncharacterized membrane protein